MKRLFRYKETIASIVGDEPHIGAAESAIFEAREIIERKVYEDPFFRITYEPYPADPKDHELIQRMCRASALADVGPFAGVAGAVATYAVERMVSEGADLAIVENGGDIAFYSPEPKAIGLFADHPVLKGVAFMMRSDRVTGICSSSAKIGPSVSLGGSDVCTVFSDDVILADCCATALGNLVRDESYLAEALESIGSVEGVKGCLACVGDKVAVYGDLPEMVEADMDSALDAMLVRPFPASDQCHSYPERPRIGPAAGCGWPIKSCINIQNAISDHLSGHMVLVTIGLMVAKAIVVRSAKIIITRKLADYRGRVNAEKIRQYVASEIKGAIDTEGFNQFTIRTLHDEKVQEFISNAVLCASPINMSPLDAFQNDVPDEMRATVRKEIHDLLDAVHGKVWSPNGFQKNIYTGGSEFQMSIINGIRDIIGYVDNAASEIRAFTDSRLTELRKTTECSVLQSFLPPEEIPIGADGYIESIGAALEERGSVTVYGPPGSGKTELCRAFANNYSIQTGRRVVWLTYGRNIESTISNGVKLSDGSKGREMDTVLAEKNLLIVVDDYTSDDGANNPLERMRCGCKRIYITRDSAIPRNKRSVRVDPPSEEEAAEITSRHMGSDDVPSGIMEAVSRYGRNPQMAAILGEAAARGHTRIDSLKDILAVDVDIGKYGSRGPSKVSEYLLDMYPLDGLDEESMGVLQVLASGRQPSDAPALAVLLRTGWVRKTVDFESGELSYSLDPVLSEMVDMRRNGAIRC